MKWLKRIVLWLFNKWYEIDIKPVYISIDLIETESKDINKEKVSRIITKDDYKCSISAYTDAKCGVIVLIDNKLYLILNRETKGVIGLQELIHDYGLISIKEEVVKDNVKTKIYSEYEIKEKE